MDRFDNSEIPDIQEMRHCKYCGDLMIYHKELCPSCESQAEEYEEGYYDNQD